MEEFVRRTNDKLGNCFNIRTFYFDVNDIFASGPRRLEQATETLRQNIERLKSNKNSPLSHRETPGTHLDSHVVSFRRDTPGQKPPSVVFVAHSLGAWVVKRLGSLSQILGCVFIDARVCKSQEDYRRYISDISSLFTVRSLKSRWDFKRAKLRGALEDIDHSAERSGFLGQGQMPRDDDRSQLLDLGTASMTMWMSLNSEKREGRFSLPLSSAHEEHFQKILESLISDEAATERKRTSDLAASFLRMGEFRNAQRLFTDLESQSHGLEQSQILEIQLKLAETFLYTGEYAAAQARLEKISEEAKLVEPGPLCAGKDGQIRLRLQIERWLAFCAIRLGDYRTAMEKLDKLSSICNDNMEVSEDFSTFSVEVHTDLALAHAFCGQYSFANHSLTVAERSLDQPRQSINDKPERYDISIISLDFGVKRATVEMLQGKYTSARKTADATHRKFQNLLGRRHVRMLELDSVRARIMTCNSEYTEAHSLCDRLVEDMSVELGRTHPLTLSVLETHIEIMRAQSRFTEALESAKVILDMTEKCLGNRHPQTLLVKSQLAAAYFDVGDYRKADDVVEELNSEATQALGDTSPDRIKYLFLAAIVLNKSRESGKAALDRAFTAFETQQAISNYLSPGLTLPGTANSRESFDSKSHQRSIEQRISAVLVDLSNPDDKESKGSHPDLLFTLEAISWIINQHARELLGTLQPEYILDAVVARRRTVFGLQHLDTLLSEFHLAVITRDSGFSDDGVDYASLALCDVWRRFSESANFGPSHPRTLIAEREAIITDCMRGKWQRGGPAKRRSEWDWQVISKDLIQVSPRSSHRGESYFPPVLNTQENAKALEISQRRDLWELLDIEETSREVLQFLEPQLGPLHPEVLSTLLWLFTTQIHLQSMLRESGSNKVYIDVQATKKDILERAENLTLVAQRSVEASGLQDRIRVMSDELERDSGDPSPMVSPFTQMNQNQPE